MVLLQGTVAAAVLLTLAGISAGQDTPRNGDPRVFDIELAPGPVQPGASAPVITSDGDGKPVVGRIHVRVGPNAIVLLPDGQLVGRREADFNPSDRRFEPLDKDHLAKRLAAEFPDFKTKTSSHYVYVFNSSDVFQFGTSRILESMLNGMKNWATECKFEVKNPPVPLVVVMFRTEAEFRRFGRLPAGVVAYYEPASNRVYMYEQSRLNDIRPDLALGQAISTIAHEGAHQILNNIGVQQRLSVWPQWLSEGLAEFFAPTTVGKQLKWKGAEKVNDLRMFELEQYVRAKAAEAPNGEMVEHTVLAGRLSSTGYATAWALVHYLAQSKRTEFLKIVHQASALQPLMGATEIGPTGVVLSNRDSFRRICGENSKDMESAIVAHLKSLKYNDPFEAAPHFVATLEYPSGRRTQRSASTFHFVPIAEKWLSDMGKKVPETDRTNAKAAIIGFSNRAQAEAFLRTYQGK